MFKKFAVQIVAGIRVSGRIGSLYRTAPKDNTGFHQGTIHKFSNFEALCDGLRDANAERGDIRRPMRRRLMRERAESIMKMGMTGV